MTTQIFRFTGVTPIPSDRVVIEGHMDASDGHIILSKFDVNDLGFESPAKVVIELWSGRYGLHRIEAGMLDSIDNNKAYPIRYCDLKAVYLDINVVSAQPGGVPHILGSARHLRLTIDGEPPSILPIIAHELGDEVFRCDFDDQDYPVLYVNTRIPDWKEISQNRKYFAPLVMTSVVEKIAGWLLRQQENDRMDDEVVAKWAKLFENLGHSLPERDNVAQRDDFPKEVARSFATRSDFLNNFLHFIQGVER